MGPAGPAVIQAAVTSVTQKVPPKKLLVTLKDITCRYNKFPITLSLVSAEFIAAHNHEYVTLDTETAVRLSAASRQ